MKAPEKIYLYESELCGRDYDDEWFDKPLNEDSVEYTRTDAFIQKALEWIRENIRPYYHEVRSKYEDFENYMKGE